MPDLSPTMHLPPRQRKRRWPLGVQMPAAWLLSALLLALPIHSIQANPLRQALERKPTAPLYRAPGTDELRQAELQFAAELAGRAGAWETLGMRRAATTEPPGTAILETEARLEGRGIFAFRAAPARDWLIQAPHSRDDLRTGAIARLLYAEWPVRAAMWNSTGRHTPGSGGEADMAHLERSHWQAMTRAYAAQFPKGRVLQLHGFEGGKRASARGAALDMIVSAGHSAPPAWVRQAATCFRTGLPPWRIGLYPDDVGELGATTNAQGRLLRGLGHEGFLHLEMSLPLRERLAADPALRRRLAACLE